MGGKTRRFLAAGAAVGVLASSAYAVGPVWAADQPVPGPAGVTDDARHSGLSAAALEEALARDLGMTPAEFAAEGELGTRAADVAAKLRDVPGYSGIRLRDEKIVVAGTGAELLAEVAVLADSIPSLAVEGPAQSRPVEAPGAAEPQGSELAVNTEQLFQAYIREVGSADLQAVVESGGKFVIRTGDVNSPESTAGPGVGQPASAVPADATAAPGAGRKSAAEFVARYANVELDGGAPLTPEADVPGGVGFIADTGWICSTGFSAFDPAGLPAVLTAGHCAADGASETATLEFQFEKVGLLGQFGFSQFGGPGNSRIVDNPLDPGNPGNVGTDVAVVESLRPDLDPVPAASTWGDVSQPGPDVKIIGTAEPVIGLDVCRSGRTSAWSCGKVDEVGIYTVPGPTYGTDPTDLRAFRGFLSYDVQSSGGDSGGPYVSGNYALGLHAAGERAGQTNRAVAATLDDAIAVLPGYQLELFLNKPAVASPAPGVPYEPGQVVSGNVPAAPASAVAAGSGVRITVEGQQPFDVPVSSDGSWSFPAPKGTETLRFTAETVNGFSASGPTGFELVSAARAEPEPPARVPNAAPAPAPAPADRAPADPAVALPQAPTENPTAVVVNPPGSMPSAGLANTGGTADRRNNGNLAYTGPSALLPAAGAAAAAIVVGTVLMVLVRRRRQHTRE
ncbi:S1 family peptidase [Arthrobacter sp. Z4-13]